MEDNKTDIAGVIQLEIIIFKHQSNPIEHNLTKLVHISDIKCIKSPCHVFSSPTTKRTLASSNWSWIAGTLVLTVPGQVVCTHPIPRMLRGGEEGLGEETAPQPARMVTWRIVKRTGRIQKIVTSCRRFQLLKGFSTYLFEVPNFK